MRIGSFLPVYTNKKVSFTGEYEFVKESPLGYVVKYHPHEGESEESKGAHTNQFLPPDTIRYKGKLVDTKTLIKDADTDVLISREGVLIPGKEWARGIAKNYRLKCVELMKKAAEFDAIADRFPQIVSDTENRLKKAKKENPNLDTVNYSDWIVDLD